jgi:acyl phosphate:glycerol-3-phosphate acyltransferase
MTPLDDVGLAIAAALVGYLVGTFPTADLVTRLATRGKVDIRTVGSGNPGGFNAMRAVGKGWGVVVIVIDLLKGALAAGLGWLIGGDAGAYAGATAGVAGHVFPVWFGFRGGKGVATAAGALLVVFPGCWAVGAAVIAAGALVLRNSERAVTAAAVTLILGAAVWWLADLDNFWGPAPTVGLLVAVLAMAAMIVGKFRAARAAGAGGL